VNLRENIKVKTIFDLTINEDLAASYRKLCAAVYGGADGVVIKRPVRLQVGLRIGDAVLL